MADTKFKSVFAKELSGYLQHKIASGYNAKSYLPFLRKFDRFCQAKGKTKPTFTKEDGEEWCKKDPREGPTTHYRRVNALKHLLEYLLIRGYEVYVVRDVKFHPSSFKPYIYSDDETRRYFQAVDSFIGPDAKDALQYPVLFRILYCCGTRVTETLSIQKKDVDLENGIIKLRRTKGAKERYIAVGDDLKKLLVTFAQKRFYELGDEDWIFSNSRGNRIDHKTLYDNHLTFLREAGIAYRGEHRGPRIHDWRHTFAVNAFKRLADSGLDMYVALPILSAYLGHASIAATETYVRLTMQLYPELEEKPKTKLDAIFGKEGK